MSKEVKDEGIEDFTPVFVDGVGAEDSVSGKIVDNFPTVPVDFVESGESKGRREDLNSSGNMNPVLREMSALTQRVLALLGVKHESKKDE